jgi:putative nucleotidyltransferase with HDIG domain
VQFVDHGLADDTVAAADWFNPLSAGGDPLLAQVVRLLKETGEPAYLVGGAVRDWLREGDVLLPHDLDFVVPGDGLRVARQIADALGGAFYPLDAARGVGRVVIMPKQTTQPAARESERRIIDVARFQGPDLTTDLAGRDFGVNAMALDVTSAVPLLIDPHGGRADLQARRLRAISDEAICNDPVRGLRAVRLQAQLGFEIEVRTQTLIRAVAPELSLGPAGQVSAERIRDELVRMLALPSVATTLRRLDELALLIEILPDVAALKGLAQTAPHRQDVYEHTLQTMVELEALLPLDGAPLHPTVPFSDRVAAHLAETVAGGHSRRLLLTLAAALHDVGKRSTATEQNERIRFIGHNRTGAEAAADLMRQLRFSGEAVHRVEAIVLHHVRLLQPVWQGAINQRMIHRFFRDLGDVGIDVTLLSLADHRGTFGPGGADFGQWPLLVASAHLLLDAYFNQQQTVLPPPLLTGRDLIRQFGLAEGPEIGRLLAGLREAQAIGQVTDRAGAEAWVKQRTKS